MARPRALCRGRSSPAGPLHAVVVALAAPACALQARHRESQSACRGCRLVLTGADVTDTRTDAVPGRCPGCEDSRTAAIRCWRARRCITSATRWPSSWPIRSRRHAMPPRRLPCSGSRCRTWSAPWRRCRRARVQVWTDRPGNLAFTVALGDKAKTETAVAPRRAQRRRSRSSTSASSPIIWTRAARSPNTTPRRDHLTLTLGSQGGHTTCAIIAVRGCLEAAAGQDARHHAGCRRRLRHQAVHLPRICAGWRLPRRS